MNGPQTSENHLALFCIYKKLRVMENTRINLNEVMLMMKFRRTITPP
jgi:hypothetical protein